MASITFQTCRRYARHPYTNTRGPHMTASLESMGLHFTGVTVVSIQHVCGTAAVKETLQHHLECSCGQTLRYFEVNVVISILYQVVNTKYWRMNACWISGELPLSTLHLLLKTVHGVIHLVDPVSFKMITEPLFNLIVMRDGQCNTRF